MVNITKKELIIESELKNKIEFICDFCNTTPTFINGGIRKIGKNNLTYIFHPEYNRYGWYLFGDFLTPNNTNKTYIVRLIVNNV